jgi:hypothetical protein
MIAMHTLRSFASPVWALLALAACATDEQPTSTQPEHPSASAAVAEPTAAPQPVVPAPAPAPEPAAAPPPPNAEPASLQLAFHGDCKTLGVSTIDDDQRVVHYATKQHSKAYLHRMDEHGAVAETLAFPPWNNWEGGDFAIDRVFGQWPDGLLVVSEMRSRVDTIGRLHRRVDGAWKHVQTLDDADIDEAWPWVDGSILALANLGNDERYEPRLSVVRGEGKGPSLAKLRRASKCKAGTMFVADAEVLPDGTVVALAGCESTTWIGTWPPGDLEGTATRVSDDPFLWSELHLDDKGDGFIQIRSTLMRWHDGAVTPVEIPGRPRVNDSTIVGARRGHAWYARGSALWRFAEAGWEPVPTPEGRRIEWAAGLGLGTPWLLFKDGTVAMQTADGTWHDVLLAPTPDLDEVPKAALLYVTAAGEAWVEAKYTKYRKGSKTIGQKLRALYTTRDAPTPLRCGEETAAANAGEPATG